MGEGIYEECLERSQHRRSARMSQQRCWAEKVAECVGANEKDLKQATVAKDRGVVAALCSRRRQPRRDGRGENAALVEEAPSALTLVVRVGLVLEVEVRPLANLDVVGLSDHSLRRNFLRTRTST